MCSPQYSLSNALASIPGLAKFEELDPISPIIGIAIRKQVVASYPYVFLVAALRIMLRSRLVCWNYMQLGKETPSCPGTFQIELGKGWLLNDANTEHPLRAKDFVVSVSLCIS
jgi:hypothetical protein